MRPSKSLFSYLTSLHLSFYDTKINSCYIVVFVWTLWHSTTVYICDLVFLHACLPKWFSTDVEGTVLRDFRHHQNLQPVSLIPVVHLDLRISPRISEKIRNDPNVIFKGLGEDDSWKKPEAKNLVTLSLTTYTSLEAII